MNKFEDELILFRKEVYNVFFDEFIIAVLNKNFKWKSILPYLKVDNGYYHLDLFINFFANQNAFQYYNEYYDFKYNFYCDVLKTYIYVNKPDFYNNYFITYDEILDLYA